MGTILFRGVIIVVVLALVWIVTARWLSALIGETWASTVATLDTSRVAVDEGAFGVSHLQFGASRPAAAGPEGWNSEADLRIGAHEMNLDGPDNKPVAALEIDGEDRLVLVKDGQRFVMGKHDGTLAASAGENPAFAPEPGDTVSMTIRSGRISWLPFEFNFITGYSPSWKHHLYFHLVWRKATGAELDMLWRYEQGWDKENLWTAPMTVYGETGLIHAEIK